MINSDTQSIEEESTFAPRSPGKTFKHKKKQFGMRDQVGHKRLPLLKHNQTSKLSLIIIQMLKRDQLTDKWFTIGIHYKTSAQSC